MCLHPNTSANLPIEANKEQKGKSEKAAVVKVGVIQVRFNKTRGQKSSTSPRMHLDVYLIA